MSLGTRLMLSRPWQINLRRIGATFLLRIIIMRIMEADCLIFEIISKNYQLLVSIEVEELSAHCQVYKELTLKNSSFRVKFRQSVFCDTC